MPRLDEQVLPTVWRDVFALGQHLLSTFDPEEQRRMLADAVHELLDADAELWLSSNPLPSSGPNESRAEATAERPAPTWAAQALSTEHAPGHTAGFDVGESSSLAIPLLPRGSILGALRITRGVDHPFSAGEIDLAQNLATQAAAAIDATRQLAVERWRVNQLSLVRQVGQQLVDVTDIDDLSRRVTKLILEMFDYYYVALYTIEPTATALRFRASAGPRQAGVTQHGPSPALHVSIGEGMTGWAAQYGREVMAPDVSVEPRYSHDDAVPETQSEAAIPLKIQDRVLGVLDVQSNHLADFSETDMLVLGALADNTAVAIERTRLYADVRRRADQLAAVAKVSRALSSILDEDKLLQEVVTLIRQHFKYPFVHVFTVRQGSQQLHYRAGSGHRSVALDAKGPVYDIDDERGIIPWVARTGKPLVTNDVRTEPRYRPSPLPPAITRSEMAVPLVFAGHVLGVLDFQSDRLNAFSEDDTALLGALADAIAIALRNASVYRSERWRHQVTDSLQRVAGLLSADVGTDAVLDSIVAQVTQTISCDVCAIWLREGDEWYLAAAQGDALDKAQNALSEPANYRAWLDRILEKNVPRIYAGRTLPKPLRQAGHKASDHSAIVAPLVVGDVQMGVLALISRLPQRYDVEDRALAGTFASQAAIAIQNAQLYDEAQAQAWLSTVLLQVAEELQSLEDPDRMAETVVRLTAMLTGVDKCVLLLRQESTDTFAPAASFGLGPSAAQFRRLSPSAQAIPVLSMACRTQTPFVQRDMGRIDEASRGYFEPLGFRGLALLPLVTGGRVLGLLALEDKREAIANVDGHEDPLMGTSRGIAYQAAGALENLRLQEAKMEAAYVAAALLQITAIAAQLTDLHDILQVIVRATPMLVGAVRCSIFLWDAEWDCFRLAAHFPTNPDDSDWMAPVCYAEGDFPLLDRMKEHQQPLERVKVSSGGAKKSPLFPPALIPRLLDLENNGAITALPLSVRSEFFGVLLVQEPPKSEALFDRRLELFHSIARQIAVAVQNDRLQRETSNREKLEQEMDMAGEIQRAFIPDRMPNVPGWEMEALSRPARHVGGDFYDTLELPDGRLGIVIADVADKGLPAALYMALTRALVRASSSQDSSPTSILERTNALLVPDAQRGMFVTALFALFDTETGDVVVANAGHLPPIIWRAAGRILETGSKGGIALGVLENIHLVPHELRLHPGDQMILYTDGVIDTAAPTGTFFGNRRLQQVIHTAAAGSAGDLLDAIDASLLEFAGETPPTDDCTIVVVKRNS